MNDLFKHNLTLEAQKEEALSTTKDIDSEYESSWNHILASYTVSNIA